MQSPKHVRAILTIIIYVVIDDNTTIIFELHYYTLNFIILLLWKAMHVNGLYIHSIKAHFVFLKHSNNCLSLSLGWLDLLTQFKLR